MDIATAKFRVSGTTSYGKKVDETATFVLGNSSGFHYGNGCYVHMETSAGAELSIDVRYDTTVHRDGSNFDLWALRYAEKYFDENLKIEHVKT